MGFYVPLPVAKSAAAPPARQGGSAALNPPAAAPQIAPPDQLVSLQQIIQRKDDPTAKAPSQDAAAKPKSETPSILDNILKQQATRGGITVAAYVTRTKTSGEAVEGADTFKAQARQFADDHDAIGVQGGSLARGANAAMELTSPLPDLLDGLSTAIAAEQAQKGAAAPAPPQINVRVKTLAVFTHGWEESAKIAVHGKKAANISGKEYNPFVEGVAKHLALSPTVVLYACRTAGLKNEDTGAKVDVPFAAALAFDLQNKLQEQENTAATAGKRPAGTAAVTLWGHEDTGHTTANNRLVKLSGASTGKESRTQLLDTIGELAVVRAIQLAKVADDRLADKKVARKLKEIRRDARGRMQHVLGVSKKGTDPAAAENVFVREIPFLGIERVYVGLTDEKAPTADSFTDLNLSVDARGRLAEGFEIFRASYASQIAKWQKDIAAALGETAKKP